jgi:Spy/CpxP family protein refolding chaperone
MFKAMITAAVLVATMGAASAQSYYPYGIEVEMQRMQDRFRGEMELQRMNTQIELDRQRQQMEFHMPDCIRSGGRGPSCALIGR